MYSKVAVIDALIAASVQSASAYTPNKPTWKVSNLPNKSEKGQVGTNRCTKYGASSKKSMCQNAFINSIHDFCLWAPSSGSKTIGDTEPEVISYCMKSGYGTRLIPDGTIKKAHFIKTPNFLQVTGFGDFTSMHVKAGDAGGELDPHGATGTGNPIGGLVFTRSSPYKSGWVQLHEWSNFMSATEFSFRACFDQDYATEWCPHIYDVMGSQWNHPGRYTKGFSQCDANPGEWPGVYDGSTFYQGQARTPPAQKPGKSSRCKKHATIENGRAIQTPYKRSISEDFEDDME